MAALFVVMLPTVFEIATRPPSPPLAPTGVVCSVQAAFAGDAPEVPGSQDPLFVRTVMSWLADEDETLNEDRKLFPAVWKVPMADELSEFAKPAANVVPLSVWGTTL